ncbi:putative nucleotide-diphospho-sugar transferase [Polynucleobacter sp. AP-Ainpum-60-G11]|uniref:putative nucleotide-diphospho-sugar transferase n=1 Tax=Polynucleobacter sp. AP-Ainpum-60-G11 TaxID=2576926 RepID=UPI001BFDEB90|nr:putative nucleotide-diphospho-sugar transferase [Polynucleobacter sp. AP-Ainpum-60-G11]QWE27139.1 hypothetical protein FD971_02290 [Polynucleobacter sp. AP-Ainpum-60-G11]
MKPEKKDKELEVVLFYINDKQKKLENILRIFKVVNENVSPKEMLEMCVWSIKKVMPSAKITLFTDESTNIHDSIENISVVRFSDIQHDRLMFDLQRVRKEYIASHIASGISKNYIFTDIDVLFNKSMEHVFLQDFDIASPATFHQQRYSPRGVPYNSLMSIINGGLWFIKADQRVISFYENWLETMLDLERTDELLEYGDLAGMVKKDFLKWWGEPHSLMVMFANDFAAGERILINYKGTSFRILDEDLYNYAPDIVKTESGGEVINITDGDLATKYLFHLRGGRKLFMRSLAALLGYSKVC